MTRWTFFSERYGSVEVMWGARNGWLAFRDILLAVGLFHKPNTQQESFGSAACQAALFPGSCIISYNFILLSAIFLPFLFFNLFSHNLLFLLSFSLCTKKFLLPLSVLKSLWLPGGGGKLEEHCLLPFSWALKLMCTGFNSISFLWEG